jgi:hypothetical protein
VASQASGPATADANVNHALKYAFSEFVQKLSAAGWLAISYGKLEILQLPHWHKFSNKQRERKFSDLSPTLEELLKELKGDVAYCSGPVKFKQRIEPDGPGSSS